MDFQKKDQVTGTSPPPVPCPNSLCEGKHDGNYEYYYQYVYNPHYFLQCSGGLAYCQACFPMSLEFSQDCNQCLYNKKDACVTTKKWESQPTYHCPDMCPGRGPDYTGNIEDLYNYHQYIACWKGVTVGCVKCPADLLFNEEYNACLYDGLFVTKPQHDDDEYNWKNQKSKIKNEKPLFLIYLKLIYTYNSNYYLLYLLVYILTQSVIFF